MTRSNDTVFEVVPLLERLSTHGEISDPHGAVVAAVRRTLEDLLNSRERPSQYPKELSELEVSLIDYGIPDFTGVAFNDPERRRDLKSHLQRAIRRYEPRLRSVQVNLAKPSDGSGWEDRTVRFSVDALIGTRDRVSFETTLDPTTAEVSIDGGEA